MKQKIKKIFENAVWWSGVIMVGLVLGLTIQFVKAWTEPTDAPPNGNIGAPINTGIIAQAKQGVLQVLGLTVYNDPVVSGDVTGKVLTAQNANGAVAWAAPSGGGDGDNIGGYTFKIVMGDDKWTEILYQGIGKFNGTLGSGGSGTFSGDLTCDPSTVDRWCGRAGFVQCSKAPTLDSFAGEQWRCARYYAWYFANTEGATSENASIVSVINLSITDVTQNW